MQSRTPCFWWYTRDFVPLKFHPRPGSVLICDFDTGFRKPEMVKRRPVVVVSPRRRIGPEVCLVVPFSTQAPAVAQPFHYEIRVGAYPFFQANGSVWAKADMLTCVALSRLDRLYYGGQYQEGHLSTGDLDGIRKGIVAALGIDLVMGAFEAALHP